MRLDEIRKIGVLGGGVMGGGIAQVMAIGGFDVVVRDLSQDVLDRTRESVFESRWGIKKAVERGKLPFDAGAQAMARISLTTAEEDLADCDFLIEAIPENLELKQRVFAN